MVITSNENFFCDSDFYFFFNAKAADILLVEQIDGKNFDLSKLRGKVVLINFWASWCKDCRNEMPILDELYRTYHDKGLEMISISIDRKKDRNNSLKLAKNVSYPIAFLIDAKRNSFDLPEAIPTAYFIDKKGNIAAKLVIDDDKITKEDLEEVLLPLLAQE